MASAQISRAELAERRAALARAIGEGTLVVMSAPEAEISRNGYVPDQNYLYLTGLSEPGGALVLRARDGVAEAQLFVADKVPAEEVWTGNRLGVDAARTTTGIPTSSRGGLVAALRQVLSPNDTLLVANDTSSGQPVGQLLAELRGGGASVKARSASQPIRRLRAHKSDAELALIRKAAELTLIGFDAAVAATAPGRYEFELEAALKGAYRRSGADGADGFPPIIASGDNATTLHYESNDSLLPPNGMVLMDVGAAYHDYVADFTRTIPVSGRFNADQRAFYQIVLDAQKKGEAVAKSRATFMVVSDSARRTLALGLTKLGLIEAPDATFDAAPGEPCPKGPDGGCYQYFLYYMHSVGHGVGLDVHDPMLPTLEPGTVFMIEMGAYVRRRMETIIPPTPKNTAFLSKTAAARTRFAGYGARMEDEYFTTPNGPT
ncbi:MAG TPA: Xaa-Pro aminopeptidase, partial [Gemmatimonadaceae bacterium]|nr:Xaa-Pro aminopeptidase [Gemmatimonadaceae bacterium]